MQSKTFFLRAAAFGVLFLPLAACRPRAQPVSGTIEVDETYVGGKPRNPSLQAMQAMSYEERKPYMAARRKVQGRGTQKAPVVALVERGGNVGSATAPGIQS